MATFYLIRHGNNDLIGHTLAGRLPGVHLNAAGRQQAARLAEGLAREQIQQIFSSPLERARETAAPIAERLCLPVRISEAFNEVDFGEWTGRTIAEMEHLEAWKQWNSFRSGSRIPGGETMLEVQARFVSALEKLHGAFPNGSLGIISHADPIRAALVYWLGMPLDLLQRIEISAASVTIVTLDLWTARLVRLNQILG